MFRVGFQARIMIIGMDDQGRRPFMRNALLKSVEARFMKPQQSPQPQQTSVPPDEDALLWRVD